MKATIQKMYSCKMLSDNHVSTICEHPVPFVIEGCGACSVEKSHLSLKLSSMTLRWEICRSMFHKMLCTPRTLGQ